ncbi:polysaccharide deacetylase family protein [Streptomyces sp. NA02950]|uniref:polysaccharide deacetylase family protein n=1 Tax=Streptomyces sp. NA02950 TaxID=2742137 RepID=UPI001591A9FB|nr:polysaccharide deacetylase family protein [Streptomyces sp. NA02950]QKV93207.1 polysaccharide deacetylase family protein [Streptomyces sp. NA02950]
MTMIKSGLSRYLVLAAAAAVFTGCGSLEGSGPLARTTVDSDTATASSAPRTAGRSPTPPLPGHSRPPVPPGSGTVSGTSGPSGSAPSGDPEAYRLWGLDRPLDRPPPAPAAKPQLAPEEPTGEGLPPVIRRVPTTDRVVFLTIDDGIEKDPRFVEEARDLGLPFTGFLTDNVIGDHYDYFDQLQRLGNPMENHTLTHPSLAGLDYDTQRQEICGQQENVRTHLGRQPRLFRPPYGEYDETTLRAAADCGAQTVVLWRAEMEPRGLVYRSGGSLQPGDIVLAHFRGPEQLEGKSMTDMITSLVRTIQEQGFTVARLEDYV